ncbi:MAG: phosphodiester glycosidase family protein [Clostridia bacterium]|nr:phosphodiester glycosidase family protein [Clostridia bacterium]
MRRSRQLPGIGVILIDVLAIGLALNVYALFHHVLPERGGGLNQSIVAFDGETPAPASTPAPQDEAAAAASTPVPSPTPSPTPAPGDFSAVFPDYDTSEGVDALYSYQSSDKRIVVYSDKVDEATYYVADVWIRNIQSYKTGFAGGEFARGVYDSTLDIAAENGAFVAISGDYYGSRREGLVIRNGVLYRESVNSDVCILYADGVMESYYQGEFDLEAAIARGAYQSWSFGPKLLDNGQAPEIYQKDDISGRHPRAAIGYFEPGHYCLVVVDGRQSDYSRGMNFKQLSELFISLGCQDAYNLDGGQTAVMVCDGEVVNRPYKNGRDVSDIVYF